MSTLVEIKAALDGMNTGFETWKKDQRELLDKLTKDSAEVRDRLEELEARAKSPGKTAGGLSDRKAYEHKQLFESWIRKSTDPVRQQTLANFEALELKDVT